jgi:hypothetical protein
LAFQPIGQPPQLEDSLGPGRVGQPVQVLGGEGVEGGRERL